MMQPSRNLFGWCPYSSVNSQSNCRWVVQGSNNLHGLSTIRQVFLICLAGPRIRGTATARSAASSTLCVPASDAPLMHSQVIYLHHLIFCFIYNLRLFICKNSLDFQIWGISRRDRYWLILLTDQVIKCALFPWSVGIALTKWHQPPHKSLTMSNFICISCKSGSDT